MVDTTQQRVWKPSQRQEKYLGIPDSVHEAFYGGAAGGGKSEILLMLPIARQFYQAPRFKGILFRRTYPELEKSLILRSQSDGFYKGTGGEYNQQLRRWKWPSGAVIDFGYAEHESDIRKYDTTEYNYIGWDELTSFTEFQYIYMSMSRARTSDSSLPVLIRSASNPGNIGHGWVRGRFVEPAPQGGVIIRDKKTAQKRIFIPSLATDNPYLMEADKDYVRRLEMLPEAEKRAKLYGDWWTFSGQVFEDWRIEPFPDEPEHAKHVVEPFQIPEYWPVVLATDWGYSAMTWNGWLACAPNRRVYLCDEYTCKQTKVAVWGTEVARRSEKYNLVDAVLDPSAWQNTGVDKTVAQQVIETSGIRYRKADNDRIGGKVLMQEYLRWQPKLPKRTPEEGFDSDVANSLMRIKGPEAYARYCDLFVPEPTENNLPKLQVFNTCEEFIRALPLCVYNSDKKGDKEDVAEFEGDDPYDGSRYGLKAVDHYFNLSAREHEKVVKRDVILNEFARTQDYTMLHRRMEKFEKQVNRKPMRRHHSAR